MAFVRAHPDTRRQLLATFISGIAAGLAATVAYDVAKALLSLFDATRWDPFEATHVFGLVLIGDAAPDPLVRAAGWMFHFSNGATFGMSFTFLFGTWARANRLAAIALGAAWGVFLESFQLALFPGWLSIKALDEFRQVSFLAHVVFGVTLGFLVRRLERRARP